MTTGRVVGVTAVVTMVIMALLGATWLYAGVHDVSATSAPGDVVSRVLNTMSERSIRAHARRVPPPPALDSAALLDGAERFQATCTGCHGAPGVPRSESGEGLMPQAPELQRESASWSEAEVYWVIRNGIRNTGMPSFRTSQTDEQMWAMAKFVKRTQGINEAQYESIFREIMAIRGDTTASSHMQPSAAPAHAH